MKQKSTHVCVYQLFSTPVPVSSFLFSSVSFFLTSTPSLFLSDLLTCFAEVGSFGGATGGSSLPGKRETSVPLSTDISPFPGFSFPPCETYLASMVLISLFDLESRMTLLNADPSV